MGAEQVNGVLYSRSGIIKGSLLSESLNIFDPLHNACRSVWQFYPRKPKMTGWSGRSSSHTWERVIRSDYPLDHLRTPLTMSPHWPTKASIRLQALRRTRASSQNPKACNISLADGELCLKKAQIGGLTLYWKRALPMAKATARHRICQRS